ncbi:hypothetical protein [Streptomyces sp. NPDC059215]|uniref:hypothetical protein n=1 Tax=unclassified Streptomyces TaxID=2593676 RepID=UPI0036C7683F
MRSRADGGRAVVRRASAVDTTCAIVGGIVAARTGVGAVPQEWLSRREALPGAA